MSKPFQMIWAILCVLIVATSGSAQKSVVPGLGISHRSNTAILNVWNNMSTTSFELSTEFNERGAIYTELSHMKIGMTSAFTNAWGVSFRVLKSNKPIAPLLAINVGYLMHNPEVNNTKRLSGNAINLTSLWGNFYLDHINYTMSAKLLADIRARHFVVQTGLVYDFMKIRVRDLHGYYHSDLLTGLGLHFGVKYLFFKAEKEHDGNVPP